MSPSNYTGCSKSKVLKIFGSSAQKYLETKIFKLFILSVTLKHFCRYAFQIFFYFLPCKPCRFKMPRNSPYAPQQESRIVKLQVQVQVQVMPWSRSMSKFKSTTNSKLKFQSHNLKSRDLERHYNQMSPTTTHPHPPPNFSNLKISSFQSYPPGSVPSQVPN